MTARAALLLMASLLASAPAHAAWQPNGNPVALPIGEDGDPLPVADGQGGLYAIWGQGRILAQHFTAEGDFAPGWPAAGIVYTPAPPFLAFSLAAAPDGDGGAYVLGTGGVCNADCYGDPTNIFLRRLLPSGESHSPWPTEGVRVDRIAVDNHLIAFDGVTMVGGSDGAIIAWSTNHYDPSEPRVPRVYAQSVDPGGTLRWGESGVRVAATAGLVGRPVLAADRSGGALVFWADRDADGNAVVHGQHLSKSGAMEWGPEGVIISATSMSDFGGMAAVSNDRGVTTVAWISGGGIRAVRVEPHPPRGISPEFPLAFAAASRGKLQLVTSTDGGVIAAWLEGPGSVVLAQKLSPAGHIAWALDGAPVCSAIGVRRYLALTSDGRSGAYLAWDDSREGGMVFASRLSPNGMVAKGWPTDGSPTCATPNVAPGQLIYSVNAAPLATGRAAIAWEAEYADPRGGYGADQAFVTLLLPDGPAARAGGGLRSIVPEASPVSAPAPQFSIQLVASDGLLTFALPGTGSARLELFDVAGRRVGGEELGSLPPGEHRVPPPDGVALRPGIYLLRLTQGSRTTARHVFLSR